MLLESQDTSLFDWFLNVLVNNSISRMGTKTDVRQFDERETMTSVSAGHMSKIPELRIGFLWLKKRKWLSCLCERLVHYTSLDSPQID